MTAPASISLARAQRIMRGLLSDSDAGEDGRPAELLDAACNTIVSLHQAVAILEHEVKDLEEMNRTATDEIAELRAALRGYVDADVEGYMRRVGR